MRSVFCDQAEPVRVQQVAVTRPADPQARIGHTLWPAVQVPFEDQDEQAGAADDVADRVVLSDLAEPDRTKVADRASTARSLENGIAASSAPNSRPAGGVLSGA